MKSLIILFVAFGLTSVIDGSSLQRIEFFENFGCTGEGNHESFGGSLNNLTESWLGDAKSLRIVGRWKLTTFGETEEGLYGYTLELLGQASSDGQCFDKNSIISHPRWDVFQFYYASRIGPSDLETSEMILFSETRHDGFRYHVSEGGTEVLPKPLSFQSLIHFGNDTWVTYSRQNLEGERTCHCPADGIREEREIYLIVGSASRDLSNECQCRF